jgi:UDP-glucose 4-epimerase
MRLILTGASGFLGKHLVNRVDNTMSSADLTVISSKTIGNSTIKRLGSRIIATNKQLENLRQITHVVHLGCFMPKSKADLEQESLAQESLVFTENLFNLPLPSLEKIIFVSSTDVYKRDNKVIDESSEVEATNAYTKMKIECEIFIREFAESRNISYRILRLGHLFGSGDFEFNKIVQNLVRAVTKKEKFHLQNGLQQTLNLMYVEDVSRIILKVAIEQLDSGVSNVVSSRTCTIEKLINELTELSEQDINLEVICSKVDEYRYLFRPSNLLNYFPFQETSLREALRNSYFRQKSGE